MNRFKAYTSDYETFRFTEHVKKLAALFSVKTPYSVHVHVCSERKMK